MRPQPERKPPGPARAVQAGPLPGDENGTAAEAIRDLVGVGPAARPAPAGKRRGWLRQVGTAAAVLALGGVALWFTLGLGRHSASARPAGTGTNDTGDPAEAISVNTVFPKKKTLERTLVQGGSVKPWAQVELYAKSSGYLRAIGRVTTPQLAADLVAQRLAAAATAPGAAHLACAAEVAWWQAPKKDKGSFVRTGEMLLDIAVPERLQDIVERESFLEQRLAELEQARTTIGTYEAAVETAKAQKAQAEADVDRYEAEHVARTKEYKRFEELARSRTVPQEVADEKEYYAKAALGAWKSSQAKVQTAQAEINFASSKLAAARADIRVKEAFVRVARDDLRRAHILADFSHVYAPFNGVITFRDVDEGDFVQNSTSGQTRQMMTVTAIDKVKVVLQVPARDAVWVQVGAEAVVEVDAHTNWQVGAEALVGVDAGTSWRGKGSVARIDYLLEDQSRTMQVEIDLDNRDRRLLVGSPAHVTLTLQKVPDAWAVPATAIYSREGKNYLMEVKDGKAVRRPVRILYDDGKEVQVVKLGGGKEVPLDGTEELVVSNKGELADGQRVKATPVGGD